MEEAVTGSQLIAALIGAAVVLIGIWLRHMWNKTSKGAQLLR